ncbi:acetylcholinesterase 1-like [Branchiostoma floridae]|uniref:Carboxylic ester hydrolase n=1 Tax=Branchiostoma floridae TaxID=7739 RepID=A0A9J7HLC5_BRAFL|nr:acetylcholinesterase 1-like [Branchiostoma floridae]
MATTTISKLLVFAALVFVGQAGLITKPDGPIVPTRYGDVRGLYAEEGAIFLGLPFGVPPVGELRWKPPRAYNTSWAPRVRDGTVPGPACRQTSCGPNYKDYQHTCNRDKNKTQSEDCLYLNVFVPRSVLLNSSVRLPVMCWFHGGNYQYGTGAALIYDGRILANKTNTVVVTTNYRLGVFGYLVTGEGEDDARGNYGTLDQIEALTWVQQNIADFGGDKDKVTVFGQSAGSDSIAVLLTSARAADLFHQGIMLSVPFSIPLKTQSEAIRYGNDFTKFANCSTGDMKCLRSKSADAILDAQKKTFWHGHAYCQGHVCHGEDIPFVFQTPLLINLTFTREEQVLADTMVYHYGNFAHTGDPNKASPNVYTTGNVLKSPLNWPRYNKGNLFPNMNFTTTQSVIVQDYNKEKCDFWDKENIYSARNKGN